METVILGLSGGVDSSVAAELLKREYRVLALYLENGAPGGQEAARAAAARAGIELAVEDVRGAMEESVCAPFAAAYLRGETPNPCVLCNPAVKMAALERFADAHGARYIATGHYVRRGADGLYMGRPANDQSYMLCRITPRQAERLLLPLGIYEKTEVRALAAELELPAAHKRDSMEICFIPGNDYAAWLDARGDVSGPGEYWYGGRCVGRHRGISRCTIGQHRNLGIALGRKVYVGRIEAETGRVYLVDEPELWKRRVIVRSLSWLVPPEAEEFDAAVRTRHTRGAPTVCRVRRTADGGAELCCAAAVRAPAPGQAAAIYGENGRLLGGGFVVRADNGESADGASRG